MCGLLEMLLTFYKEAAVNFQFFLTSSCFQHAPLRCPFKTPRKSAKCNGLGVYPDCLLFGEWEETHTHTHKALNIKTEETAQVAIIYC